MLDFDFESTLLSLFFFSLLLILLCFYRKTHILYISFTFNRKCLSMVPVSCSVSSFSHRHDVHQKITCCNPVNVLLWT